MKTKIKLILVCTVFHSVSSFLGVFFCINASSKYTEIFCCTPPNNGNSDLPVHVKIFKYTVFYSGSFCQIYRVTGEPLIAETAVWPNFFLMNVFFALKGSKLFIII